MSKPGGARHQRTRTRRGPADLGIAALLGGAIALAGGLPASANPGDGSGDGTGWVEPVQPVDPTQPVDQQLQPPAPPVVPEPVQPQPVDPAPVEPAPAAPSQPGGSIFSPVWIDPAVVPEPPVNDGLPVEIDARGEFAQQISCDPLDRPGVTAFALLLSDHYNRPSFSGARPCISYASFHHDGRALDWPLAAWDTQDRMIADSVIVWLTANDGEMAKRFGLEYLIWNHQIWQADGRGWSWYDGHPHDDHIHFSFTWDGAQMRTSWWTGVAVAEPDLGPCALSASTFAPIHLWPRFASCEASQLSSVIPDPASAVAALTAQGLTNSGFAELDLSLVGPQPTDLSVENLSEDELAAVEEEVEAAEEQAATEEGVRQEAPHHWQRTEFTALRRTTLTEGDSGEEVKILQTALGVEPDGAFGPKTAKALAGFEESVPELALQAARRGEGKATVTPLTWTYLERAAHPSLVLRDHVLEIGDLDEVADPEGSLLTATVDAEGEAAPTYAGGAVAQLQRLLNIPSDGSFGHQTRRTVIAVQEKADLEPTGVVDAATWAAIEARAIRIGSAPGTPAAAAEREARAKATREAKAQEAAAKEKEAAEQRAAAKARAEAEAAELELALESAG